MVDALNASSTAASGLYVAQYQVGVTASSAANAPNGNSTPTPSAPFGSSAVVATSTGTQPGGVSGNAYNALQSQLSTDSTNTTAQPTGGPNGQSDPTQQQVALVAAQQAYHANLSAVQATPNIDKSAINLLS